MAVNRRKAKMTPFMESMSKTPRLVWGVGCQGRFGIEIEVEGKNLPNEGLPRYWNYHNEGSLRGGGAEYVSKGAFTLEQVPHRVSDLKDFMLAYGSRWTEGAYRASTHVHVNVSQEQYIDILGVFILNTIIEPVLFRLGAPERDGNLFCMPSYDCGDINEWFENTCKMFGHNQWNYFKGRGKYAALNYDPLTKLGSIEWRIFPSTMEGERIHTWCTWLRNILDVVRKCEDKTFYALLEEAQRSPIMFLQKIFGEIVWQQPTALEEMVEFGCMGAHELCRTLKNLMNEEDLIVTDKTLKFAGFKRGPQVQVIDEQPDLPEMELEEIQEVFGEDDEQD
jgi:hypothetical protein